jgi:hypothetical protein
LSWYGLKLDEKKRNKLLLTIRIFKWWMWNKIYWK